jgi:hypothetical protein
MTKPTIAASGELLEAMSRWVDGTGGEMPVTCAVFGAVKLDLDAIRPLLLKAKAQHERVSDV